MLDTQNQTLLTFIVVHVSFTTPSNIQTLKHFAYCEALVIFTTITTTTIGAKFEKL
jgi:hypothetical protein